MDSKKRSLLPQLPEAQLRIRTQLKKRFYGLKPTQTESLAVAYNTALKQAASFSQQVQAFTNLVNAKDLEWKCRPGDGVKSPARILEKAFASEIEAIPLDFLGGQIIAPIPLDFLGGKIIAPSLKRIYQIAERVEKHFTVCGFEDRFEIPQKSEYRDLQFQVKLKNGHVAELKIVHRTMDQLDDIEHRIYEIVRMLATKQEMNELNESETKVYDALGNISKRLYRETWETILKAEVRK